MLIQFEKNVLLVDGKGLGEFKNHPDEYKRLIDWVHQMNVPKIEKKFVKKTD